MFHGSDSEIEDLEAANPVAGRQDLCLTDDPDVASAYGSVVHEIDIDNGIGGSLNIADEEEAKEIIVDMLPADSIGDGFLFEYLDDPEVMEAIVEAGFHGVDFLDQCPDVFESHDTIRLYSYRIEDGVAVAPN